MRDAVTIFFSLCVDIATIVLIMHGQGSLFSVGGLASRAIDVLSGELRGYTPVASSREGI
jgi:hypothetical protein